MSVLERQAERIKLEKLLGENAGTLGFLDQLPASAVVELREQVTATLFDSHAGMFERLASSGKLLPVKVSAVVAEKGLGPMLCGRVAGLTPVERAVALAEKLHVPFMADVSTQMDPRRVRPLLQGISEKHIRAVAHELAGRNDVITMGRFIDALPVATTERVMAELDDDGLLLRVAFFAEDKGHLSEVVRRLPEDRLRRIIAAAREQDLWCEALALMNFVEPDLSAVLSDLAAGEAAFFEGLLEEIQSGGLWEDALVAVENMGDDSRRQFLAMPRCRDDEVLQAILATARDHGLWEQLHGIRRDMNPQARERLRELGPVFEMPAGMLED